MAKIAHLIHNNQSELHNQWIKLNSYYLNHPQNQISLIDIDLSNIKDLQHTQEMCNYYGIKFDKNINQPMVIISSDKDVVCIKGDKNLIVSKFIE